MKLNSKLISTPSDMTILNPSVARDNLSFVHTIYKLIDDTLSISDLDTVNKNLNLIESMLSNKSKEQFMSVFNALYNKMNVEYRLQNLLFVTRAVIKAYSDSVSDTKAYDKDIVDILSSIYDKLRNRLVNDSECIKDMYCDAYIRFIGNIVSSMRHNIQNDAPYSHRVVTPVDISTDMNTVKSILSEAIDGGSVIKSISNYSDTRYFPQLTHLEFSPDEYISGIYNETDDDYIVNRIKKLPDFLKSIIHKDNCYDAFIHICEFIYDRFSNNATALDLMSESLKECVKVIETATHTDYSNKESFDRILNYCNMLINSIDDDTSVLDKKPIIEHCPLIEMGFGYIYDILPPNPSDITENNIDAIGNAMIEATEENDILNILTEAMGRTPSNKEIRKKIKQDAENDIYRTRIYDDYSDERRVKDDKYSDKRRRESDKYDLKLREEQDEYERKREEKERKKNRTKTAWAKWKTMELTTPAVYSATRALKRLLSATAVGGVAYAAGFNPVFLPIVYLLGKYMKDKSNPENVKVKIMSEIKQNLSVIDAKIDQAERQNDMKQKYELIRMKDKLEGQFKRMGYGSTTGIGGKI